MNPSRSRFSVLMWLCALSAVAWLAVGDRLLTHWAYAMERGRMQATDEELAELHANLPEVHSVSRAFKLVAKIARPGVVHLFVEGGSGEGPAEEEFRERLRDELEGVVPEDQLDYWLERREFTPPPGMGSGIILDDEGHILTNNHVVEGRETIGVILHDEREFEAELIGTDPKTDLAVVKVAADDLHPLRFGDSDLVEVGDWVIAVGAPFGLSQTVTHGIVSATGRTRVPGVAIDYQDFIQTDAAINPGNSGGPLLDLRGRVIGVNTAIATRTESNAGIAFTIPANMATKIAQQLIEQGVVRRGYLGILPVPVMPEDVEALELSGTKGVVVERVLEDSPAERGGLEHDDVIVAVEGAEVADADRFRALVADLRPNRPAKFEVIRDGQRQVLRIELGLQPENTRAPLSMVPDGRPLPELELRVRTLRPALSQMYPGVDYDREQRGVIITGPMREGGPLTHFDPGELIVGCDDRTIESVADLRRVLDDVVPGRQVELQIKTATGDRRLVSLERQPTK